MVSRLAQGVPLRIGTVVASAALTGDDSLRRGVRKGRGTEGAGVMARVAR